MSIIDKYKRIADEVSDISAKCGRDNTKVKILAVSKTVEASRIQDAINSGIELFGENRIQEAKAKRGSLHGSFSFHMIGHLQSNKAPDAVKLFDLIHSIDKISTAQAISKEAEKIMKKQKILIQLKTHNEPTKSGVNPDDSFKLAENILNMKNLILDGVMVIGPITDNKQITRESFRKTATTLFRLNNEFGLNMEQISMGMSDDFQIAIEEGSTLVRIGSLIFGKRI